MDKVDYYYPDCGYMVHHFPIWGAEKLPAWLVIEPTILGLGFLSGACDLIARVDPFQMLLPDLILILNPNGESGKDRGDWGRLSSSHARIKIHFFETF